MKSYISHLINHKTPCFFISPHFDDAALSAGGLIKFLAKKTSVTVINVFTQGSDSPSTFSAQRFVKNTGYATAESLFQARRDEDRRVLESLGACVINLGLTDALWRQKTRPSFLSRGLSRLLPEFSHLYPLYHWHIVSGRPHSDDRPLIRSLARALSALISPSPAPAVFCPLGLGGHVDHQIVRQAVEKCFRPVYWQDQPYITRNPRLTATLPPRYISLVFSANHTAKKKLLRGYSTQINLLFPSGKIPQLQEKFYYPYV